MLNHKIGVGLGIFALLASLGCGGGKESQVSGHVKLDGNPVGPGTIVFVPAEGASNPADGAIQVDGSYSLKTSRTDGLNPGKYKVTVTVLDQPEVQPGERSMIAAKLITPEKYRDPATSGLEFSVEPGSNKIDVELTSN